MTYKEIYRMTMSPAKEADEKYLFWDRFLRIPATFLIMPLISIKTNPTTITKLSILSTLISFCLISFASTPLIRIVGWGFILLWGIMDNMDGQLARCTNQCSNLGDLWDTMGGYLAMISIYFSAGIAAFFDDCYYPVFESYLNLIWGGATAILSIFPRLMMQKKKNYGESSVVNEIVDKSSFGFTKLLVQNLISPTAFLQPIFLLSIIFHVLDLFVLFYFLLNSAVTLLTLKKILK